MPSINAFRVHCPICAITLRADRVLAHLKAKHLELVDVDLNAMRLFLQWAEDMHKTTGLRLELDLAELSFQYLPGKTCLPAGVELNAAGLLEKTITPELCFCARCEKFILRENFELHQRNHLTKTEASFVKLKLLPRYSTVPLPISGQSVQGGSPGLGKRA